MFYRAPGESAGKEGDCMTMKQRPAGERPYEKCVMNGPASLSDGELLAVVIRCGTRSNCAMDIAMKLLDKSPVYKGLEGLYHLGREELKELDGIGDVKATELLCILELSKRLARSGMTARQDFCAPEYIADYFMEEMRHLEREVVKVLFLDNRHRLLREMTLSEGSTNGAPVPVKNLLMQALRVNASFMVMIHNHPSGCPEPSREDLVITQRVKQAGELVGITLSDHIIIGDHCYHSMLEHDLL